MLSDIKRLYIPLGTGAAIHLSRHASLDKSYRLDE